MIYKKTVIFFALLIGFIFGANAQSKLNLTIVAQPNMSYLNGKISIPVFIISDTMYIAPPKKSTLGYATGLNLGYNINKNMGFKIGVLFYNQGQQNKNIELKGFLEKKESKTMYILYGKMTQSFNYIKVPLVYYFTNHINYKLDFTAYTGLYFSAMLNYKENQTIYYKEKIFYELSGKSSFYNYSIKKQTHGLNVEEEIEEESDFTPKESVRTTHTLSEKPYKNNNVGVILGAGIEYKYSQKIRFPVCLHYETDFQNIKNYDSKIVEKNKNYWNVINSKKKLTNSAIGLNCGVKILF